MHWHPIIVLHRFQGQCLPSQLGYKFRGQELSYRCFLYPSSTVSHSQPSTTITTCYAINILILLSLVLRYMYPFHSRVYITLPIWTLGRNLFWKLFRKISPRNKATYSWHTWIGYTDTWVRNLRTLGSITCLHMSSEYNHHVWSIYF